MSEEIKELLIAENFNRTLKKYEKIYCNKRIVCYGAGIFFKTVLDNYDLSNLNIMAVSDISFKGIESPLYDEELGFNKISPEFIHTLKPDIVLISALQDYYIEKYFLETLFKQTPKFKYKTILERSLRRKIQDELLRLI